MGDGVEQVLNTMLSQQSALRKDLAVIREDVKAVNTTLLRLISLEERQATDRREIEGLKNWNMQLSTKVTDLRIGSAVMMVKIAAVSGSAGSVAGGIVFLLAHVFEKSGIWQ